MKNSELEKQIKIKIQENLELNSQFNTLGQKIEILQKENYEILQNQDKLIKEEIEKVNNFYLQEISNMKNIIEFHKV